MTVHEQTRLLPRFVANQVDDDDDDDKHLVPRSSSRRRCIVGISMTLVLIGSIASSYWNRSNRTVPSRTKAEAAAASSSSSSSSWRRTAVMDDHVWNQWEAWRRVASVWDDATSVASESSSSSSSWIQSTLETMRTSWNDKMEPFKQQASDWVDRDAVEQQQQHSSSSSNSNTTTSEAWVRHTWNSTSQQVHSLWQALQSQEQDLEQHEQQWWNVGTQSEQQWWNTSLYNIHQLGIITQQWWNQSAHTTVEKERSLQKGFQQWWQHATEQQKQWWIQTLVAYRTFARHVHDQEAWWWNVTQQTVVHARNATRNVATRGWNVTSTREQEWWDATRTWYETNHIDVSDLQRPLLYLNSTRAYQLIMSYYGWFDQSADFFNYQQGWDVQSNQAYCGVASVAALLNSLYRSSNLVLPTDPRYDPHPYATQHNLLSIDCVHRHVVRYNDTFDGILNMPGGLTLFQVQRLVQCHVPSSWNVTAVMVDDTVSVSQVRNDLHRALQHPLSRVLVNVHRPTLDQEGGGHMSPVAGYSSSQDAFLLMDVAKYKYPPVWIPTARLHASMHSHDACSMWDFPSAQDHLDADLLWPSTSKRYDEALKKLHCKPGFRGYIIATSD